MAPPSNIFSDPSAQSQSQLTPQPREFELRRADLISQIGDSLEQVLTQINALNRSMESIIEIGNEFASVEALWSQFESVMGSQAQQPDEAGGVGGPGTGGQQQQQGGGEDGGDGSGEGNGA